MQGLPLAEAIAERILPGAQGRLHTIARLRRGTGDPTHRHAQGWWWRATRTPDGPALLALRDTSAGLQAKAWGRGRERVLDGVPALIGLDDPRDFAPEHPLLADTWRRHPTLSVGRTGAVMESLVPAIIEQKVTGKEAFAAFRRLVYRYGEPAPGPAGEPTSPAYGMRLQPTPAQWAAVPSWEFLRAGFEPRRARVLVNACRRAVALERLNDRPEGAETVLTSLPGIGPWTSSQVRQTALGDPDAWSIGDYHVPGLISLALTGESLDDAGATRALEPYRGHRYRVEQLVMLAGPRPQRRGPRRTLPTHFPR